MRNLSFGLIVLREHVIGRLWSSAYACVTGHVALLSPRRICDNFDKWRIHYAPTAVVMLYCSLQPIAISFFTVFLDLLLYYEYTIYTHVFGFLFIIISFQSQTGCLIDSQSLRERKNYQHGHQDHWSDNTMSPNWMPGEVNIMHYL